MKLTNQTGHICTSGLLGGSYGLLSTMNVATPLCGPLSTVNVYSTLWPIVNRECLLHFVAVNVYSTLWPIVNRECLLHLMAHCQP